MEYICRSCGCVFDTPAEYKEPHTELDGCPCEIFSVCPSCMEPGYEIADECEVCGDIVPQSEITTMGLSGCEVRVCEHCRQFNEELEEI